MFGTSKYNYKSFSHDHTRNQFAHAEGSKLGPRPGERAPSFEGITLDGQHFALKNLRGARNLVLTFGCATCPSTAASIRGLNDLYRAFNSGHFDSGFDSDSDTEFLFVYVREAHPGERTPAHASLDDKCRSAVLFRHQEHLNLPILVDDLDGRIHRSYGGMPNSTFLIERSGRVAYRSSWTNPKKIRAALEELLQTQELFEAEKLLQGLESQEPPPITVLGGEDLSLPGLRGLIHTNRALERGGRESVRNYRIQMGRAGCAEQLASRFAEPLALHPARAVAASFSTRRR